MRSFKGAPPEWRKADAAFAAKPAIKAQHTQCLNACMLCGAADFGNGRYP